MRNALLGHGNIVTLMGNCAYANGFPVLAEDFDVMLKTAISKGRTFSGERWISSGRLNGELMSLELAIHICLMMSG
jgi:hypothetical protein